MLIIVLELSKEIPKNQGYQLYFDNWFSTFEVMLTLKSSKLFTTATYRANRLQGCPLALDQDLKKQGRGSFDYLTDVNTGLHVVKWFDNRCVHVASTFSGVKAEKEVQRWDGKQKNYVKIKCPDMVSCYNSSMGGVDLADMLISLYRTNIITKKRWYLKIIFHLIDICKVNGWLMYRRHCKQRSIPSKTQMSLLAFSTELSSALRLANKSVVVGRKRRSCLFTFGIGVQQLKVSSMSASESKNRKNKKKLLLS